MMKILFYLVVLALCACGASSRPTTKITVQCLEAEDGSYFFSKPIISFTLMKQMNLSTPVDVSCTSVKSPKKCIRIYYDGLVKVGKQIPGIEKLEKMLASISQKDNEGEIDRKVGNLQEFFENLKTFVVNLGRNCT